jgi:methylenetetrahydrofolate dehydrogenase (NADP+) / methenyltetrahydrofolate cyclohydrolase
VTGRILEGGPVVEKICEELKPEIDQFRKTHGVAPTLALVRVGNPLPAVYYSHTIDRTFTKCGMGFQLDAMPDETTTEQLIRRLSDLARAKNINGILLQHPLPKTIDARTVTAAFPVSKDVEGISPTNIGNLALDIGDYFPTSTPSAALEILNHYAIPIEGKRAVIVGRSNILGKPMALLLLRANATVTICHSHTCDLASVTRQADLLIAAVGHPKLITADMVSPGAVVIDCGLSVRDGELIGDVDFQAVKEIAAAITPVPGGAGAVTAMTLMRNTLSAAQRQAIQSATQNRRPWLPLLKSRNRKR